MTIDLATNKEKLFNKLFYAYRKTKDSRYVVVFGGAGSGKSVSVVQAELIHLLTAKHDTLYLRKNGSDLYESCYKEVNGMIDRWELNRFFRSVFSMSKREIANRVTGKKMVFRGVDDPGKLKSIVGFQRIIMEEADQFTLEDFLEITRRARGIKGIQIVLVFNPVNIEHWIKKLLFDTPIYNARTAILHTTYKDNKFLQEDDKMALEMLKEVNPYDYDVYVLGKWGVIRPKDPFFFNFNDGRHVRKTEINKFLPIYLSFDFNIVNSCISGQVSVSERYVRVVKEWHQKGMDLEDLVMDIIHEYGVNRHYVITGDASGNSGSALTKGNIGAYDIIRKTLNELDVMNVEFRVPNSNLGLLNSKSICNAILKKEDNLHIDEGCTLTKNDIMRMRQSSDGGLDKKDANAKDYGHLGDCFRYFLSNFCMDLYTDYKIFVKN